MKLETQTSFTRFRIWDLRLLRLMLHCQTVELLKSLQLTIIHPHHRKQKRGKILPVQKHVNESSDEDRLFQVYTQLLEGVVFCDRDTRYQPDLIQAICKAKLEDAKIIMEVFNARNLNDQIKN